jgi:hypothetical protein
VKTADENGISRSPPGLERTSPFDRFEIGNHHSSNAARRGSCSCSAAPPAAGTRAVEVWLADPAGEDGEIRDGTPSWFPHSSPQ